MVFGWDADKWKLISETQSSLAELILFSKDIVRMKFFAECLIQC